MFCQRLLARGRLLRFVATALALALGWLVASRPDRAVGAVLTDPLVQSLGAGAGTMLLVVLGREWILLRLDAWFYPEIIDQREALAHAATVLAKVTRIATPSRTVSRTAKWGCGSPVTLLLGTDTEAEARDFSAPDAKLPPLARGSTIAHILETRRPVGHSASIRTTRRRASQCCRLPMRHGSSRRTPT